MKVTGVLNEKDKQNQYDVVGEINITSIKEIANQNGQTSDDDLPKSVPYEKDGTCPPGYVSYGEPLQCITQDYSNYCEKNPCPICLSPDTNIDTPSGSILITNLKEGMPVWTMNKKGERVSGTITKITKTAVPQTHRMIHLILSDGRELFVSPKHPTANDKTVAELLPNEIYDGARIVSTNQIPTTNKFTYDILPSGETGFYWANGILLGSTLR